MAFSNRLLMREMRKVGKKEENEIERAAKFPSGGCLLVFIMGCLRLRSLTRL